MAPAHPRPGRPPSSRSTNLDDHRVRIGWLLRVNRLYGADETAGIAADFARRLRGTSLGHQVDVSTITRWEQGERPVPRAGLLGYEEILGLPGRCLVAVAEAAHSMLGQPFPRRPVDPGDDLTLRRTEDLVDRAVGGGAMSGGDWADLTGDLLDRPQVVLVPRITWTRLAERLLAEMIIAESTGWLQRTEALNNLLRRRPGAPAVIGAVADLTNDRANQVFVDPLTLLESVDHPDATAHLLRQLADPTNEHALRGAWCSVAEKIRRDHFSASELELLSRHAAEVLADDTPHPACRVAAAELLRHWKEPALAPRVVRVLQRAAHGDVVTRHVLRSGRTESAGVSATVVRRLVHDAVGRLPRQVLGEDPALQRLTDEMLFHPQISRRLLAAQFIEASPYREPLAGALLAEFRGRVASSPPSLVCAVLAALGTLGGQDARQVVQQLVLASGLPPAVTEAAAWSLGHMRGVSPASFWLDALDLRVGGSPARPGSPVWSTARGLVYGVGVSRDTAVLRRLSESVSHEPDVRAAARWWLGMPRPVLESTSR